MRVPGSAPGHAAIMQAPTQHAGLALAQPIRAPMGTTPPITTNDLQNSWFTKPDQAREVLFENDTHTWRQRNRV